jgi:hypothetical protein
MRMRTSTKGVVVIRIAVCPGLRVVRPLDARGLTTSRVSEGPRRVKGRDSVLTAVVDVDVRSTYQR